MRRPIQIALFTVPVMLWIALAFIIVRQRHLLDVKDPICAFLTHFATPGLLGMTLIVACILAHLSLLFKKCALVVVVGGLLLFGISLFRLYWVQSSRTPAEFPQVGPSSRIILHIDDAKHRKVDISGQDAIINAIRDLKHQHIVGRSIGTRRVQGLLEIDGKVFKLDASMIEDGFRATVENEIDGWEGRELGKVLYNEYGGK